MNAFVTMSVLWTAFVAAVAWPNMRKSGAAVRWFSLLLIGGAFAVSYYVWDAQLWFSPAVWIMRALDPLIPFP